MCLKYYVESKIMKYPFWEKCHVIVLKERSVILEKISKFAAAQFIRFSKMKL